MKKALLSSLVGIAVATVSFTSPPDTLVGRWQQKFKGMTALFVFRADDTADLFINGKLFTTGKYTVRQDTFAIADPKCNPDYYGTYKLDFFAQDSVRFIVVRDTCSERSMNGVTLGRVIADKP